MKLIDKIKGIKQGSKKKYVALIVAIVMFCLVAICGLAEIVALIGTYGNIAYAKSFTPIGSEYEAVLDENGYYTFTLKDENDDFRIMQITDIHLGCGYATPVRDRLALKTIYKLAQYSKPNLIVITGDVSFAIMGYPGNINNARPVKQITALLETIKIPYIFTFGNHDTEIYNLYDRVEIADMYASEDLKYSLFKKQTGGEVDVFGEGNSVIKIKNHDGTINNGLFFLDSNDYTERKININGGYDCIHKDQIEWYKNEVDKLSGALSMAFFHIPLQEYEDAWVAAQKGEAKLLYGYYGEIKVSSAKENSGFFDAVLEKNSTKAIFVGHDHINTFGVEYKGVVLSYCLSIDRLAYIGIWAREWQRGANIIDIKADSSFEINQLLYGAIK